MRCAAFILLLALAGFAGEKKLPVGEAANDVVSIQASVLDDDHLQQIFGSDFGHMFSVLEVTLTPKGDKPLDVRLDDFLLRSEQTGANSGPLQAAQIGGQGGLVVNRGEPRKQKAGFGIGMGGMMGGGSGGGIPPPDNTKVEVKDDREKDPLLGMLKRKILVEKMTTQPVTALLFFPLDKEKPKHLALIYTTAAGKLRFKFK